MSGKSVSYFFPSDDRDHRDHRDHRSSKVKPKPKFDSEETRYKAKVTGMVNDQVFSFDTNFLSDNIEKYCFTDRKYSIAEPRISLGKGAQGEVVLGCYHHDDQDYDEKSEIEVESKIEAECNVAIKIFPLVLDPLDPEYIALTEDHKIGIKETYSVEMMNVALKDSYFLNLLQDIKLDDQYIVPRLLDKFACNYNYLFAIVMDKFDFNMDQVGVNNFNIACQEFRHLIRIPFKRNYVFYSHQLIRMFQICHLLSIFDVFDGDLKPDNFLYRKSDNNIVAADFGFAGNFVKNSIDPIKIHFPPTIGWLSVSPKHKCVSKIQKRVKTFSPPREPREPRESKDVKDFKDKDIIHIKDKPKIRIENIENSILARKYFNVWQLNQYLESFCNVWVTDYNVLTKLEMTKPKLFGGFKIPVEFIEKMILFCPMYASVAKYVDPLVAMTPAENLFTLDLTSIGF